MINNIGSKRLGVLLVLGLVNAALAATYYMYLEPGLTQAERQQKSLKSQISSAKTEAERLRTEFQEIQTQQAIVQTLEQKGFYGDQDRILARDVITSIRNTSRVLSADYTISPAVIYPVGNNTVNAEYVILSSPVSIAFEALDDRDIYAFIYWVENEFPGFATVESLQLSIERPMSDAVLRSIGNGSPVSLVDGKLEFTWKTMVPREKVSDYLGVINQ